MPNVVIPLSQLPEISANQLYPESFFEASVPCKCDEVDGNRKLRYVSKKITKQNLSKNIGDDVIRRLDERNQLGSINVYNLRQDVNRLFNEDVTLSGTKTFVEDPKINNKILLDNLSSQDSRYNDYSVNFETLKKYSNTNSAPLIDLYSAFATSLSGSINGQNKQAFYSNYRIDQDNLQINTYDFILDQSAKDIAANSFLFKIDTGAKESNVWTAPVGGIFTCYGWLDELQNERTSNENRWVALMGYNKNLGTWSILQLQPFTRSPYISYVGFTFPVKKGMQLKVMTGFAVGSNSDKYFASGSSVSNKLANAFLGGVYTSLSSLYDMTGHEMTHVENSLSALSISLNNRISELSIHEQDCDLSNFNRDNDQQLSIELLSTKLNTKASIAEVNERSRFFGGSTKYPINNATENIGVRTAAIMIGNSTTIESGGKYGVFTNGVTQRGRLNARFGVQTNCLSVNWEDWNENIPTGIGQRVYGPPPGTTQGKVYDQTKTIERAYTFDAIKPGTVFSDGKYMYYMVSQDSTVVINLSPDWSNKGGETTYCWVLYRNGSTLNNLRAVYLGVNVDTVSGISINRAITLPLKKGTILMFGLYKRQMIPKSGANPAEYISINQQQIQGISTAGEQSFSNMLTATGFERQRTSYSALGPDGSTITYNLWTSRFNPNLSRIKDDAGKDIVLFYNKNESGISDVQKAFAYDVSGCTFGTVATIVELP